MQTQTVFKAGNSNAVVIPKEYAKLGFKHGLKVSVNSFNNGDALIIQKIKEEKETKTSSKVSGEFKKWLETTLKEDGEILDELA